MYSVDCRSAKLIYYCTCKKSIDWFTRINREVEIHYDYCLEGRHRRASLCEIENVVNKK
jgi:hypothetical protein